MQKIQKFKKSQSFIKFFIFVAVVFYVGSFFAKEKEIPENKEIFDNSLFLDFDALLRNSVIDLDFVNSIKQDSGSIKSIIVPEVTSGRKNPFVPTT